MISDYCSLFSAAVRELPHFSALTEAILSQAHDLISLIPALQSTFSVDTAEGVQLDLIGETLGVPRFAAADSSDDAYRAFLKAKLCLWRWNGTNESVTSLLAEAFPGQSVTLKDNGDMTVSINAGEISKGQLPVPAGVKILSS